MIPEWKSTEPTNSFLKFEELPLETLKTNENEELDWSDVPGGIEFDLYEPYMLENTIASALSEVDQKIFRNKQLDLKYRHTFQHAVNSMLEWGDLGFPVRELKKYFRLKNETNPTNSVIEFVSDLNYELQNLEGPKVNVKLFRVTVRGATSLRVFKPVLSQSRD